MGAASIECRNVWKIFGAKADAALAAIRSDGLTRGEVKRRFGVIVGVADASFKVEPGEILSIMGLSGSGKSTLLRHLNRLIEPTAGDVLIGGASIAALDPVALRQLRAERVAMVFQHTALWPHRSVWENVAFGLEIRGVGKTERRARAEEALDAVQLSGWSDHRVDELSGGMQQRVGLARAVASDPDVLLMDEPFSALDPLIRRQLQDQFVELAARLKKTTVFITHDLEEAIRLGGRIAIMKDGEIVQSGTADMIVGAPANDYVAAFVGGISRLRLITAGSIAEPLEKDWNVATAPLIDASARLSEIIDAVADHDGTGIVTKEGVPVGAITRRGLLRVIQTRQEAGVAP